MVSLTSRSEAFTVKMTTFCRSYQPWAFECCFALNTFVSKLSHIGSIWMFKLWKLSFWFRVSFFQTEHLSMGSRVRSSEIKRNSVGSRCKWLSLWLQVGFISASFFWLSHSHILLKRPSLGLWKLSLCEYTFSISVLENLQWSLRSSCVLTPFTLRSSSSVFYNF